MCPHCRRFVPGSACYCPHCGGGVGVLAAPGAFALVEPPSGASAPAPDRLPVANEGWGRLHVHWALDGVHGVEGVLDLDPDGRAEIVLPAIDRSGRPAGHVRLESRTEARSARWRLPSPALRSVTLESPGRPGGAITPRDEETIVPRRPIDPAEDCTLLFCEPDRWDAWIVAPGTRHVRRLGGGEGTPGSVEEIEALVAETRRLQGPPRGARPRLVLSDGHALLARGIPPRPEGLPPIPRSRLVLEGWRARRVPGPEAPAIALLELERNRATLRILERDGRPTLLREEAWDGAREPRSRLLHGLDSLLEALLPPPLAPTAPILALGAALDDEAVWRHLMGRSFRLCPHRAQPLCCLGMLAATLPGPRLELEADEGDGHASSVDLPFCLSPGPDRVDVTYALPAGRALVLRLHERDGAGRRLLARSALSPLERDAPLVFLVRETPRGRLSVDVHDPVRGCRQIMDIPPPSSARPSRPPGQ